MVVSAVPAAITLGAVLPVRIFAGIVTGACGTDCVVDDAVPLDTEVESFATVFRGAGLGGNSN